MLHTPVPPEGGRALAGTCLLIVEDQPFNTLALGAYLRQWSCDYELATNGLEALEILNPARHALVLMDIHMPGMDGLEATRLLRQRGEVLPIIALTADQMLDLQRDIYPAGFTAMLLKPFEPRSLLALLLRYLPIRALVAPDTPVEPSLPRGFRDPQADSGNAIRV